MEPERNIEKELKAYAQQRRAAAGTPPELHPANRKQLQEEAARLAKAPDRDRGSWWQTFWRSWPRLAVAGAFVAAVAIVTLWSLSESKSKQESLHTFASARREVEVSKDLAQAEKESANRPLPPPPASAPALMSPAVRAKAGAPPVNEISRDAPAGVVAAAPSPAAPAPVTALTFDDAKKQIVTNTQRLAAAESPAPALATSRGFNEPSSSVSPKAVDALDVTFKSATPVAQLFRRAPLPRKSARIAGVSNVLASFRVEQNMDKLRIIDKDGSVYLGAILQSPEAGEAFGGALAKTDSVSGSLKTDSATTAATSAVAAPKQPAPPQRLFRFRVSGTNQTLKKEVVFTGNFLMTPASMSGQPLGDIPSVGALAPAGTTSGLLLLELTNARMEGRIEFGKSNKIDIKAIPVKP